MPWQDQRTSLGGYSSMNCTRLSQVQASSVPWATVSKTWRYPVVRSIAAVASVGGLFGPSLVMVTNVK